MTAATGDAVHQNNKAFYDRISKAYDFIADANEHTAREAGQNALALRAGETVLEIGFGTGNSIIDLARAVGPAGQVFGIDISEGMKEVTAGKLAKTDIADRVTLQVGDARKLPYADNTFDAAFTSFTLELFPLDQIPGVLAEVKRVLKPGGRVGIVSMATTKPGQPDSALEKTYKWFHRHFPHIVDCQPIDAIGYVKGAGFDVAKEVGMEIWTMPVRAVVGVKK